METTVLEVPDDTPETNPPTPAGEGTQNPPEGGEVSPQSKETETPSASGETHDASDAPGATSPPESEFEIDGEKLTASQIRELKKKYDRDTNWVQRNEARAAELKREREELAPLLAIKPILEQRPELYQQLFTPPQKRNYDAELQQLYMQEPDRNLYPEHWAAWKVQIGNTERDKYTAQIQETQTQAVAAQAANTHNTKLLGDAKSKFVSTGKLSDTELYDMATWVGQNIVPRNGMYPENSFDIAYLALHSQKAQRDVAVEAARKAIEPLKNARPVSQRGDNGIKQPEVQPTPEDEDDNAFISMVKSRTKNYTRI